VVKHKYTPFESMFKSELAQAYINSEHPVMKRDNMMDYNRRSNQVYRLLTKQAFEHYKNSPRSEAYQDITKRLKKVNFRIKNVHIESRMKRRGKDLNFKKLKAKVKKAEMLE